MKQNVITLVFETSEAAAWNDPIVIGTFLLAGIALFSTLFVDWRAQNRLAKRDRRERMVVFEILSAELSQLLGEAVDVHVAIERLSADMTPEDAAHFEQLIGGLEPDRLTIQQPDLVSSPTEWHKHLDAGLARHLGEVRCALSEWYSLRRLASDRWAEHDLRNLSGDLLEKLDNLIDSTNSAIEKLL